MIQGFALPHGKRGARRGAALLLAVLLNLALVPCTMALEVGEETHHGHDCCPPEIQLDPAECCDIDEANVATRADELTPGDDLVEAPPAAYFAIPRVARKFAAAADPPDPPAPHHALHKLNCVYLK